MEYYRSRRAAKDAIWYAEPFTVFQATMFQSVGTRGRGEHWDMFLLETEPDEEVAQQLEWAGIDYVDFEPQRSDEDAPRGYSDMDAAVDALGWGFWLVKVPDGLTGPDAKFFRLYVVRSIKPPRQIRVTG